MCKQCVPGLVQVDAVLGHQILTGVVRQDIAVEALLGMLRPRGFQNQCHATSQPYEGDAIFHIKLVFAYVGLLLFL